MITLKLVTRKTEITTRSIIVKDNNKNPNKNEIVMLGSFWFPMDSESSVYESL